MNNNKISTKEFMDKLNNSNNLNMEIKCDGIITTNIEIKNYKTLETQNYIKIFNKNLEKENVKINIHQIMKIEIISDKEYIIKFDGPQTIKILIF